MVDEIHRRRPCFFGFLFLLTYEKHWMGKDGDIDCWIICICFVKVSGSVGEVVGRISFLLLYVCGISRLDFFPLSV